ncbi:polyphosphate polymerase domain-containing protein [Isoptericola sp. AK164]|uniref:polyphosphate polymerase domain-containing protein n=1 Tax=Isoptericola sp. AK164 TaxID=3024246 RepID=UPI002418979B|nr:polyphosphate polymerase domain-containing protein [Isoptericola sp. AK164]
MSTVEHLAPVTLDELNAEAALQTRVDRKYVLTADETRGLLAALDPSTRALEIGDTRTFTYSSTYFDTPDLVTFHQAARRRRRRFKVRTRTYVDTGGTFLEVKTRAARGVTVKERCPADPAACTLDDDAVEFVDDRLAAARLAAPPSSGLAPVLRSRYRRTTLLTPDARVTLDTALTWRHLASDGGGHDGARDRADIGDLVVVETKAGTAPSSVDRLLWRSGHRPDRISKYATGLAVLRPDLPDHPWRRLRRERLAA